MSKNTISPRDPALSAVSSDIPPAEQTFTPLYVGVVGGGRACYDLLKNVHEGRLAKLNIQFVGVSTIHEDAPGYQYAKRIGLFTTNDYRQLYTRENLNLIVELTGSDEILDDILQNKPSGVSLIDHRAARILWVPLLKEAAESDLEALLVYHKRKKQHTQTILDSLPYRIMVVNDDMTIAAVNQTFLTENNLKYEDVLGKHCYEVRYNLDSPCSHHNRACFMEEVKKKGEIISTIHEVEKPDGDIHFEVITVSPVLDDHGNIVQLLEASRDVTDRIKLEKEAQKTGIFLQNVIQSTVDGIVVVNTKGYVLLFNEGMEKLTGYTAREIMEHGHLSSFYDIEVARENMKKMRSDQRGPVGKLNPTTMSVRTKTGEEVPVTLSASIITVDGKEVGSVGVFTDMREFLKMQRELEEAHLHLVQSEKIASVGKMAAGVAHEINNPLSGVLLYAEILKENLQARPDYVKDIQEIIDQTLRCKKIVSELLEFSRQSIGKASSFSMEGLLTKCLDLLIHQALFHNIEVEKAIESGMPGMVGDMGQLQQVFINLFINAADAMDGKGKLRIEARYLEKDSKFIIRVSDTGPGIPLHLRDKIFDIFFTTKQVGKGTGLGLSISQNIIELHGGTINFECPLAGGTTFHIELPLEYIETTVEEPVFVGLDE